MSVHSVFGIITGSVAIIVGLSGLISYYLRRRGDYVWSTRKLLSNSAIHKYFAYVVIFVA